VDDKRYIPRSTLIIEMTLGYVRRPWNIFPTTKSPLAGGLPLLLGHPFADNAAGYSNDHLVPAAKDTKSSMRASWACLKQSLSRPRLTNGLRGLGKKPRFIIQQPG
jgi:hypothetical protein